MLKNALRIKRVYDAPQASDGFRILIDGLWPRGMKKTDAAIDLWLKEIAPSKSLRAWFNHDPEKWMEFKKRYFQELNSKQDSINLILEKSKTAVITLLYSAKNEKYNNAVVLQRYLKGLEH